MASSGGNRQPESIRLCRWTLGLSTVVATVLALLGYMQTWNQSWLFGGVVNEGASVRLNSPTVALVVKDIPGGPRAPLAKQVVVGMDTNVNTHKAWNNLTEWMTEMEPYWTRDAVYDFNYVGPWHFGPSHGVQQWFYSEHMHFNIACPDIQWQDFIRAATDGTCTSASYGLGRWMEPFAGVPPPSNKPFVRIHDLDFYLLEGNRIKINWCIIDVVNLFEQVGYKIVPPAPMPSGGYRAPNSMDGFPAPLSESVNPADTMLSNRIWNMAIQEDYVQNTGGARWWAEDMVWYGPGGIGTAYSKQDYRTHFLEPLHGAFSNVSMQLDLSVCEGKYCGAHFYLHARHTGAWLGKQATGKKVRLRCGAHAHFEGGRMVEGWLIIDVPQAFADMGIDLFARARDVALQAMQTS
eukprot:CAMPEP_0172725988 /NCGR_PEP_ID=MMETSP1074-20121228/89681_1 /TAXON_ID=2916 /ORGANISM="Ceratium fusus, Strain PA161109" /LENGTH=406 /DNA_ID=CAMNT_0013552883 /DNA_START=101 /DNA_END=1324 /DNA_ORIENTATION=+